MWIYGHRLEVSLDGWRHDPVDCFDVLTKEERWDLEEIPKRWYRQQDTLDNLCSTVPDGEFLYYLVLLHCLTGSERQNVYRAIRKGRLRSLRTPYGHVVRHDDFNAWLAESRCNPHSTAQLRHLAEGPVEVEPPEMPIMQDFQPKAQAVRACWYAGTDWFASA